MRKIGAIGVAVVVAVGGMAVVNGALFAGYTVRDYGKEAQLDDLERSLTASAASIEELGQALVLEDGALAVGEGAVAACQAELAAIEARAGSRGLEKRAYDAYVASVDACNGKVADFNRRLGSYDTRFAQYEAALAAHNLQVGQYNAVARSMGRTWLVLVPTGRRGRR
jgi:hypothetical protein